MTVTANPGTNVTLGNEVRWTAVASGGTTPYQSFVWSGVVSGSGTNDTLTTNYTDSRISDVGQATAQVKVTDAVGNTAIGTDSVLVVDNRRPQ